jgi:hypothetical protein
MGDVRSLYNQLVGEATRLAEQDRARAKRRGPVAKTLLAIAVVSGLFGAVTFFYGVYRFPDGPLRETPGGYVSKHGHPRTREDYEMFKLWEKVVWATFGFTFLTGFSPVAAGARRRTT